MNANLVDTSDDVTYDLVERAIAETVEEIGDEPVSAEQLEDRAKARFTELVMRHSIESFMADTISATLIEVAARDVLSDGAEPFSIERVVDEAMTALEKRLGAPAEPDAVRGWIREYLDEAHGRSGAGAADLTRKG